MDGDGWWWMVVDGGGWWWMVEVVEVVDVGGIEGGWWMVIDCGWWLIWWVVGGGWIWLWVDVHGNGNGEATGGGDVVAGGIMKIGREKWAGARLLKSVGLTPKGQKSSKRLGRI